MVSYESKITSLRKCLCQRGLVLSLACTFLCDSPIKYFHSIRECWPKKQDSPSNKVALFTNDRNSKVVFTPFRTYYFAYRAQNIISSYYQTA